MTVLSPEPALAWLEQAAGARQASGLRRTLVARRPGEFLDFAGNDYLGLSRAPAVVEAAVAAARSHGAGATASRAVTGTSELHLRLEQALAAHVGAQAGLVLSSGYLANLAAVTALSGPDALVVSDAGNHASIVDACRLSRSRVVVVASGDVAPVDEALQQRTEQRAVVVTDAVFSTTGRLAPLAALHVVSRRAGALLVVDEAHALGVVGPEGRGVASTCGLAGQPDVVLTATLSKALGSQGGVVLGPTAVRDHLVDTARPLLFDTALAPPATGAALAALALVDASRVAALHAAVEVLAGSLGVEPTGSAVLPLVLGDPSRAAAARDACLEQGVLVGCFRPPSVPVGQASLRLTVRADHSRADLDRAAEVVLAAMGRAA